MFKKVMALFTLLCFVLTLVGCYSQKEVLRQEAHRYPNYCISKVELLDKEVIRFDTKKGKTAVIVEDRIEGFTKDGTPESVPLSSVHKIYLIKPDPKKFVYWIVGTSLVVGFFACVLTKKDTDKTRG